MKKLPIVLAVCIAIILLLFLVTSKYWVVQKQSIPVFVKVAPYVGLSVDKDKLHFGAVPKGGSSRRMIFLYNNDTYVKSVSIKTTGQASQWLKLSDNHFKLASYENKTLNVTVSIPRDAEYGNYTGNLILTFRKA